uniref:LCP family protein n=1 Tax=Hamadaea tsunoensis TaxID=53368 RepID=UPI00389935CE
MIVAGAVVLTLTLLVGGAFSVRAMIHRYDAAVHRGQLLDATARQADPNTPDPMAKLRQSTIKGPLNYLLVGSDRRATDPDAGQRSDTIIIAQVDRDLRHVYLVSIPRDLYVDIPAYKNFEGGSDKINAAYDYGGGGPRGVQLLSATLTKLTGVKFDGAAIIEFSGFRKVIDLLGGVNLCVDHDVTSIHTGKHFTVGCRMMNGTDALDYSRQRYNLPDGDYDRQRHQQQLLKAIFKRAGDGGVAYNPLKLDALIRAVGDTLTVDTGGASLPDLLLGLRHLGPDSLTGVRLPSHPEDVDDISYVFLDDESAGLFAAMRSATLSTWATAHGDWINPLG